jgi:hypothetical protein
MVIATLTNVQRDEQTEEWSPANPVYLVHEIDKLLAKVSEAGCQAEISSFGQIKNGS